MMTGVYVFIRNAIFFLPLVLCTLLILKSNPRFDLRPAPTQPKEAMLAHFVSVTNASKSIAKIFSTTKQHVSTERSDMTCERLKYLLNEAKTKSAQTYR